MELPKERLEELLSYCHLEQFADDPATIARIKRLYGSAVGYLRGAGVAQPAAESWRRDQYDQVVDYLVLDGYDRRDMTITGTIVAENPAFRRMLNQLKWTEPPAGAAGDAASAAEQWNDTAAGTAEDAASAAEQRNDTAAGTAGDAASNSDTGADENAGGA